MKNWVDANE